MFGHGLWCCPSFAGCLWCSWLGLGFGLLMGRVLLRARFACPPPFLVPVCGVGVRAGVWVSAAPRLSLGGVFVCMCARAPVPRGLLHLLVGVAVRGCVFVRAPRLFPAFPGWGAVCGRACWARVSAVPRPSWFGCRAVFFALFSFGRVLVWLCGVDCWVSLSRALWSLSPHPLSFGLGCWPFFFSSVACVCKFWCPFSRCSWLGVACFGWVVPLCLFGGPVFGAFWLGGLAASCGVGGRFGGCGLFSHPPLPPPAVFFSFWGRACLFLPLPSLGWRTHWTAFSVVFRAAVRGCVLSGRVPARGSGGLCTRWARRPFLPG